MPLTKASLLDMITPLPYLIMMVVVVVQGEACNSKWDAAAMSGATKTVYSASCSTPRQAVHFNSAAILLDRVDTKVAHQQTDGDRCTSFAANGPQLARAAHQVQHQVQEAGWFPTMTM